MTPAQRDCYEVLGVARDADPKTIRDAFRSLALKYHPDRNKEPDAEEHFKEIAGAYAVLSDPKKRREYDAHGFKGISGFNTEDLFGGIDFDDLFDGLNFNFGRGGLFGNLFHSRRTGPRPGANIELDLMIPLERVANGGDEEVRVSRPVACTACHGTGEAGGAAPSRCEACEGTGHVTHTRHQDKDHIVIQHVTLCPTCKGRGVVIAHPCSQCHGAGQVQQEEILTVKIPKGVEEGMALRVAGKGMPSEVAGGPTGDLYVVVQTRSDPRLSRDGVNLLHTETISIPDAVLGTTVEVPTLVGSVAVEVPAGTQPDTVLRLKGQGLPAFGKGSTGDLYVSIGVRVPDELTRSERELYEKLRVLKSSE